MKWNTKVRLPKEHRSMRSADLDCLDLKSNESTAESLTYCPEGPNIFQAVINGKCLAINFLMNKKYATRTYEVLLGLAY